MNTKAKKPTLPPLWPQQSSIQDGLRAGCARCGDLEKALGELLSEPVNPACGECHLTRHSKKTDSPGDDFND